MLQKVRSKLALGLVLAVMAAFPVMVAAEAPAAFDTSSVTATIALAAAAVALIGAAVLGVIVVIKGWKWMTRAT